MSIIIEMKKRPMKGGISGVCAKCGKTVWEGLCLLDDTYNVWAGKCPYCSAINYLSLTHGLRGYGSTEMYLVLPTEEEAKANELPEGTPTSGPCGHEPNIRGSNLGEFCARLIEKKGNP